MRIEHPRSHSSDATLEPKSASPTTRFVFVAPLTAASFVQPSPQRLRHETEPGTKFPNLTRLGA